MLLSVFLAPHQKKVRKEKKWPFSGCVLIDTDDSIGTECMLVQTATVGCVKHLITEQKDAFVVAVGKSLKVPI